MNIGRELNQIRENSNLGLFQNLGYQTERLQKKSITLDTDYLQGSGVEKDSEYDDVVVPVEGQITFRVSLDNPLRIDKTSEIYIDNVYILNKGGDLTSLDYKPILLGFPSFPEVSSSNNKFIQGKTLLLVDESLAIPANCFTVKNKKLNYVTTINPMEIGDIEFTLEQLSHPTSTPPAPPTISTTSLFNRTTTEHLRIIIELVVITQ